MQSNVTRITRRFEEAGFVFDHIGLALNGMGVRQKYDIVAYAYPTDVWDVRNVGAWVVSSSPPDNPLCASAVALRLRA